MKTLMIFAAGAVLAGSALAQGPAQANNISAPVVRRQAVPPVNVPAQSEGSIQRAVRLGNPLELFNPMAPVEYGSGRDFTTPREEDGPRRRDRSGPSPVGLRLFTITF